MENIILILILLIILAYTSFNIGKNLVIGNLMEKVGMASVPAKGEYEVSVKIVFVDGKIDFDR